MKRALGRRALPPLGWLAATIALAAVTALPNTAAAGDGRPAHPGRAAPCRLGDGGSHVSRSLVRNVHFAHDNPHVPSDLHEVPHLLVFLKHVGAGVANTHQAMDPHTAHADRA